MHGICVQYGEAFLLPVVTERAALQELQKVPGFLLEEGRFLLHPCNLADQQSWEIDDENSLCIPPKWVVLNLYSEMFSHPLARG